MYGFRVCTYSRWEQGLRSGSASSAVAALVTILLVILPMFASASEAGDATHFLRDGLGASGRAVGSAFVALADDYSAVFWNPALPVQSPSTVVGGGLEQRNGGLFTFNILGGWHAADRWSGGVLVVTSDLYDIYHVAGGVRYKKATAGLAIKSYQFGVPGDRGSGLGLDIGARYTVRLSDATLSFAAVSRDVGWTAIRWGAIETLSVDRTAWVNRMAVAMEVPLKRGMWSVEVDGELATRRPPNVGEAEYWRQAGELNLSLGMVLEWGGIRLRAGVQRYTLSEAGGRFRPTVGLGMVVGTLSVDLALVPSPLGVTYLGGFQAKL